jgi:hypothetical protein
VLLKETKPLLALPFTPLAVRIPSTGYAPYSKVLAASQNCERHIAQPMGYEQYLLLNSTQLFIFNAYGKPVAASTRGRLPRA